MSKVANQERNLTYTEAVDAWAKERKLLRNVEPFTAKKAAEKALLFKPWIGTCPVDEIEPAVITKALIELSTTGGRKGKGLASATLRAAHLAGTQTVSWAIAKGMAKKNPFEQTQRPKAAYRQAQYLTMEQASLLTDRMAQNVRDCIGNGDMQLASFSLAVCIALSTGMRRGEIFALEWDSIDEANGRISISQAIKGDGTLGLPKSKSSIRSIAIGRGLANLLADMRAWQAETLPAKGWADRRSIICDGTGSRASMNTFEHWWRKWADENGWKGLRFHELRHTHATLLIAGGADVKTVQMRLGHSSAEITMSCYAHAIPLSDSVFACSLDASLFG